MIQIACHLRVHMDSPEFAALCVLPKAFTQDFVHKGEEGSHVDIKSNLDRTVSIHFIVYPQLELTTAQANYRRGDLERFLSNAIPGIPVAWVQVVGSQVPACIPQETPCV